MQLILCKYTICTIVYYDNGHCVFLLTYRQSSPIDGSSTEGEISTIYVNMKWNSKACLGGGLGSTNSRFKH